MRKCKQLVVRDLLAIACVAIALWVVHLWVRSYRVQNQFSCRLGDSRYTIRTERGKLALRAPPSHGAMRDRANALATEARNDDIQWNLAIYSRPTESQISASAHPDVPSRPGVLAEPPRGLDAKSLQRPLLLALEKPERFVLAHYCLTRKCASPIRIQTEPKGDSFLVHVGTLDVQLKPVVPPFEPKPGSPYFGRAHPPLVEVTCQRASQVYADPSQIPRLVREWHDRLDVQLVVIPLPFVVAVLLLPASLYLGRRLRFSRRLKAGLCPNCGYDLRKSPEQCPECGSRSALMSQAAIG